MIGAKIPGSQPGLGRRLDGDDAHLPLAWRRSGQAHKRGLRLRQRLVMNGNESGRWATRGWASSARWQAETGLAGLAAGLGCWCAPLRECHPLRNYNVTKSNANISYWRLMKVAATEYAALSQRYRDTPRVPPKRG